MNAEGMIVGLDIGTTKVCVVIGELNSAGVVEITGIGKSVSTGMKKGAVVNVESTTAAIEAAVEAAELMSGQVIRICWTGIGGKHVEGINSRGVVAITGHKRENREISCDDVMRVIEAARAVVIPLDREIIQTIPQSYIVDDHRGIKDPLGMIGVRLESEVHIITVSGTSRKNLIGCVNRAGFRAHDHLILQVLAAGRAVLSPEERELGVALIDLGGGTTDVLVYHDGAPYSTFTVPLGGIDVTRDISMIKSISMEAAERIKCENACCWETYLEHEDILLPNVAGPRPISIPRSHVYEVVRARMEEIFELVKNDLDRVNHRALTGGIVITGGGASLLGVMELASEIFKMPVRIGVPLRSRNNNLGGMIDECCTPSYATAIGLVLEGADREANDTERAAGLGSLPSKIGYKGGLGPVGRFISLVKKGLF